MKLDQIFVSCLVLYVGDSPVSVNIAASTNQQSDIMLWLKIFIACTFIRPRVSLEFVLNQSSKMAEHSRQPEELVICLPQTNFIEILKREEARETSHFTVKSIDDGDVLHVTVSESTRVAIQNNQVTYELLHPDDQREKSKLVEDAFGRLKDDMSIQVVFLITVDNHIEAYTRKTFTDRPKETKVLLQPSKDVLHSRSKGLLESGLLEKRKVAVIGLGSGGSHVAIELAKAGVGNFVLVDYDRIELNNIVRHTCGVSDLGRLKTKAIRERILDKNPFACVELHNSDINDLQRAKRFLDGCDLIVAATDTSKSRSSINMLSLELNIAALFGKCSRRASGGEVIIVRPNQGPCFSCVCGNASEEHVTSFHQAREANPSYVSDSEVEATIQVGLSSDIIPISNMIVKIALVELCKGQDSVLASLEKDFQSAYYIWANRRDAPYLDYQGDFTEPKGESILRWYAVANAKRNENCAVCCCDVEIDLDSLPND